MKDTFKYLLIWNLIVIFIIENNFIFNIFFLLNILFVLVKTISIFTFSFKKIEKVNLNSNFRSVFNSKMFFYLIIIPFLIQGYNSIYENLNSNDHLVLSGLVISLMFLLLITVYYYFCINKSILKIISKSVKIIFKNILFFYKIFLNFAFNIIYKIKTFVFSILNKIKKINQSYIYFKIKTILTKHLKITKKSIWFINN